MTLLKKTNKPVYLLLGNHDVEDQTIDYKTLESKGLNKTDNYNDISNIPVSSCEALTVEEQTSDNDKNIHLFKNVQHRFDQNTNTLIIMIDTNVFEKKLFTDCYLLHGILKKDKKLENASPSENINDLRTVQFNQVEKLLKRYSNVKNIIFAGHHPIVVYKVKENEYVEKQHIFEPAFIDFFKKLSYQLKERKKIYYLCADSHFYEESIIDIKNPEKNNIQINQYIVGTGGAELDDIDINKKCNQEEEISFTYNILNVKKAHGFLLCEYDKEWKFQFNQTFPEIKESSQALLLSSPSVSEVCGLDKAGYINKSQRRKSQRHKSHKCKTHKCKTHKRKPQRRKKQ